VASDYLVPVGPDGIYTVKTGKWRTHTPVLDAEKCVECGICFMYCPVGAIKAEDGSYRIDLEYCKGCGICAYECPQKAIRMMEKEEQ